MSHGSEEGENYWPGYVDALTSMVQVLAFVMMMLAMAVFSLSQSVTKKAVEAIAKAVNADVKPNADVKQLTQSVMEQLDRLRGSAPADDASKPAPIAEAAAQPDAEKPTTMRMSSARSQPAYAAPEAPPDAPRLTVIFAEKSFTIDSDEAQSIAGFVNDSKAVEGTQTIIVNAYAYTGEGAVSEARRLAYYRAMMARKQMIGAKLKPENIRISVNDTVDKAKGLTVELIVAGSGAR
jgi:hypothetical protein